jgi:hypothetical protein
MGGFISNIKSIFSKKDERMEDQTIPNSFEVKNEESDPEIEIVKSSNSWDNYSFSVNFDSISNSVNALVREYREIAMYPEVDEAVIEIVNESVVQDGEDIVKIDIDTDDVKEKTKETIQEEFSNICKMLDFNADADAIFRQWYVDGRIYLHGVIDLNKPKEGIQDIKVLSPFNLRQIKKENKLFFISDDKKSDNALQIPSEHITFISSTLTDPQKQFYIGHLHKAIKPYNQLKMLEDAAIIYRITRAPERRVFYVDVGQMNKPKAESYIASLISKFKNKVTYDSRTGKISQDQNSISMIEDFWLPSSESAGGSRGTKIDVLPGGQQLGELTDINYFNKKLKRSLNVPFSRFDSEERPVMSFGNMNGELGRDEVRFSKFINKLRYNFSKGLADLLKKQLIFKGIMDLEEWLKIKDNIKFVWNSDSYFSEVKESEIMKNRVELADVMQEYTEKYFSHLYIMKNVFQMTDEEIKEEKKNREDEEKDDELNPTEDE